MQLRLGKGIEGIEPGDAGWQSFDLPSELEDLIFLIIYIWSWIVQQQMVEDYEK